jgi:hypothetical protein
VGTLSLEGEGERLEYSLLEGSCRSAEVIGYLDALASEAERRARRSWWSSTTRLSTPPERYASAKRADKRWDFLCTGFRRTARTSTSSRGCGEGSRVSSCHAASTTRWAS